MGSSHQENSRLCARRLGRSVVLDSTNASSANEAKEERMAVAMMVDNPGGSQEIYDKVRERLGLERPAGGIFHVAGPRPNGGWRVVEVWESEDDAKRFVAERLLPAFEAVGAPAPPRPELWPVHNHMA
jgi:hypothetical protein